MSRAAQIHSTAIVDPAAVIGEAVRIGPLCVVGANVTIGDRTELVSHVVVEGPTELGPDNVVSPFASIGGPPQDLKYGGEPTRLIVGARNNNSNGSAYVLERFKPVAWVYLPVVLRSAP